MPGSETTMRAAALVLYALAVLSARWIGPAGPVYWDSFGYVADSITGRASGLMLGRPGFALSTHLFARAWLTLGGSVWTLEPALRLLCTLMTALTAPAVFVLACRLDLSRRAACIAGVLVALSPALSHTAAAVLTDGPSLALSAIAFVLATPVATTASRRAMLAAACVLGLAATLREQSLTHIATLVALALVAPRRKTMLACIAVGAALLPLTVLVAGYALRDPSYVASVRTWSVEMSRERAQHPYGLRDLALYVAWLAALGPVALVAAVASLSRTWRRALPSSPAFLAVCVPSAVMLLALAGYQDIAFSPRYLIGVFPFAIAIPAARVLDRWQPSRAMAHGVALSVFALALAAGPVVRHVERPLRSALDTLPRRLATVSPRAVIVTGQLCPAVVYRRRLSAHDPKVQRERPDWVQVCPGWRWPSALGQRLDAYVREGRAVVLDLRDVAWQGPRQRARRDEVARYAATHAHQAEVIVWQ